MNPELAAWSARVRDSLGPLQGRSFSAEQWLPPDAGPTEVAMGYTLGLLSESYNALTAMSGAAPGANERAQEALARCDASRLRSAQLVWLGILLRMFVRVYQTGTGDPLYELREFADAWGPDAENLLAGIEPRGLDALYFGRAARARYVRRLETLTAE